MYAMGAAGGLGAVGGARGGVSDWVMVPLEIYAQGSLLEGG